MKRILVVEDDRSISGLLQHLLEGQGYEVTCAFDGLEALSKLKQFKPDLVITDINMPQMTGLQLLESLKVTPKTKDIPVLMCTENNLIGKIDDAYLLGAQGYIVKPFSADRVINKVKEVLEKRQSK